MDKLDMRRKTSAEVGALPGNNDATAGNTPLDEIIKLIDIEKIESMLLPWDSGAEKTWPARVLFRILLIGVWYGIPDRRLAEAIGDRRSFRRFAGLPAVGAVPHAQAIGKFRAAILTRDLVRPLMEAVNKALARGRFVIRRGAMLEAALLRQAGAEQKLIGLDEDAGNSEGAGQVRESITPVSGVFSVRPRQDCGLEEIGKLIDWEIVDALLAQFDLNATHTWPATILFKIFLLGIWYGIPDRRLAAAVGDRYSFRRFAGLPSTGAIPQSAAIIKFHSTILARDLVPSLMDAANHTLARGRYVIRSGAMLEVALWRQPCVGQASIARGQEPGIWMEAGHNWESAALASRIYSLSPQQFRVLAKMLEGKLNKQIAWELGISEVTTKTHVTVMFRKLGVSSRTQAAVMASTLHAKLPFTFPTRKG